MKKNIKRIETDITQQTKFINAVSKIFKPINMDKKEVTQFWVMDCCNICMIEAKSDLMKDILKPFFDFENTKEKPNINYENQTGHSSKYNSIYLKRIADIFSVFERVKISMAGDYPICFENDHLKIILAPCVTNDED